MAPGTATPSTPAGSVQEWANGLRYEPDGSHERLVDAEGVQVAHSFERVESRRRVDELLIQEGADVLEVGFGFGFSAERIQEARPRSHTIVECAPEVLRRLRPWAAERPNVTVVEGTWQARLPELGTFGHIFFDDHGSEPLAAQEIEKCPNASYLEAYRRCSSHEEGFESIARAWHSRPFTRIATASGTEFQNWADGLFFSLDRDGEEQLLDVDGAQVMMKWEKPYMEKCVEALGITSSCTVLEVGFGCGSSADCIQKYSPKLHVIIECAEVVLERLKAWAADKPNVLVVQGTWQARLPELGRFDRVFFDDYGEPGLADREMAHCPDARYREEYAACLEAEGGTHFEAFVCLALKWHACEGIRITGYLLHPLRSEWDGAEVSYDRIDVKVPEHCNYFFADRAVVPLIRKRRGRASTSSRASESTRSARSGSHRRSPSSGAWSSSGASLAVARSRSRSSRGTRGSDAHPAFGAEPEKPSSLRRAC